MRGSFRTKRIIGIEEEDTLRPVTKSPVGIDLYDVWANHVKAHLDWPLMERILERNVRRDKMNGILLALQFFTVLPIRKQLPLGRKEVTAMYIALPFVGAPIGLMMYGVSVLLFNTIEMGPFFTAVFIVLTGIMLTGGLHLDGWADTGDAFFSYQDRTKSLDILEDPRLGAFGTMALVSLILVKIALFHEVLIQGLGGWALFVAIPLLSRAGMNIYFTTIQPAKNKGIAYFFKGKY